MAKLTKDEFISSLKEMNLLEIKELLDAMKEEFGVDPSAVAVAAPAQGFWGQGDCHHREFCDHTGEVHCGNAGQTRRVVRHG